MPVPVMLVFFFGCTAAVRCGRCWQGPLFGVPHSFSRCVPPQTHLFTVVLFGCRATRLSSSWRFHSVSTLGICHRATAASIPTLTNSHRHNMPLRATCHTAMDRLNFINDYIPSTTHKGTLVGTQIANTIDLLRPQVWRWLLTPPARRTSSTSTS